MRTRETTEDLKKRIEANNIFVSELHFKPECIVAGKCSYGLLLVCEQLGQKNIQPWKVEESSESNGEIRISLDDKAHSVPKYTAVVSPNLEFCVFAFNWPVPDCNTIFKEHKRSVKYLDIVELLEKIENFGLCEGLTKQEMDIISVAVDPTGNPDPNPATIVHHTIPKAIQVEEPYFEVTLSYRSVSCDIFWIVNIQKKYASHVQVPLVQLGEMQERKAKPLQHQQNQKPL